MKNYSFYLPVFILVTLLCLWCCTACMNESYDADLPNDSDVENTSDPDTDADIKDTEPLAPSEEVFDNTDEPAKEVELAMCVSDKIILHSLDELNEQITAIQDLSSSDERYDTYSVLNISSLAYYYVPDITLEGYELTEIWVSPYSFIFLYYPIENSEDPNDFAYFGIGRIPYDDPLLDAEKVSGQRREDGKVFIPNQGEIVFQVESYEAFVHLPKALLKGDLNDWILLTSLCKVRKVYLDSTLVTES